MKKSNIVLRIMSHNYYRKFQYRNARRSSGGVIQNKSIIETMFGNWYKLLRHLHFILNTLT